MASPLATAVMTPEAFTVAMDVLLLDQVPPVTELLTVLLVEMVSRKGLLAAQPGAVLLAVSVWVPLASVATEAELLASRRSLVLVTLVRGAVGTVMVDWVGS